jgi:hypothetical protein
MLLLKWSKIVWSKRSSYFLGTIQHILKKSLKIPKGQSESVYRRRTDNTMVKRKVQKDKQRSTKHTYKTKDRVTRTPVKTEAEFRCSGRVSSSCSTSDTRRVNLVINPAISREWGKDREVFTSSGTYPWILFRLDMGLVYHPAHGGNDVVRKTRKNMLIILFFKMHQLSKN